MKINHNIAAAVANNTLKKTQNNLTSSLEKLSSGYRINKAADDAAGMAISQKMHAQIRGLERASRNCSDGISAIQTAEGALNETESMLQRMRELAVQAANGTNTLEDTKSIQSEIDELKKEINRVSTDTEFNKKTLLDGSCDRQSYSTNADADIIALSDSVPVKDYEIKVTTAATQASLTGSTYGMSFSGTIDATTAGVITINGTTVEAEIGDTLEDVYGKLRTTCEYMNISVTPLNASGDSTSIGSSTSLKFATEQSGSDKTITISGDNTSLLAALGLSSISGTTATGVDAQVTLGTGFGSTANVATEGGKVTITDRDGFNMILNVDDVAVNGTAKITVQDAGYIQLQVGANEGQTVAISIPRVDCETLFIDQCNVCTSDGAQSAITAIDDAVNQVSQIRSKLGAYQNRMESAIASLDTGSENLTEALSRIEDVDMAEEMSNYTQLNVLSQAGTSMLAEANNSPQTVLQLLQG